MAALWTSFSVTISIRSSAKRVKISWMLLNLHEPCRMLSSVTDEKKGPREMPSQTYPSPSSCRFDCERVSDRPLRWLSLDRRGCTISTTDVSFLFPLQCQKAMVKTQVPQGCDAMSELGHAEVIRRATEAIRRH